MTTPKASKPRTKTQQLVAVLKWRSGRSLDELSEKFGWQSHTTRAAMTRLRQAGHQIEKIASKDGKPTRYRIPSDASAEA